MKLKTTKFEFLLELIAFVIMAASLAYMIMMEESLPQQIVTHYNAQGVADQWGSRSELYKVPLLGMIIYTFATVLQRFPKRWNVGISPEHKNAEKAYRYTKDMIIVLKTEIVIFFAYFGICTANQQPPVSFFLPSVLIITFGTIIVYMMKVALAKKEGLSPEARMEQKRKWLP